MDLKILEIASDTENNKNIKNYTHAAKSKNPLCGDEIEIKLVMKNEKLVDFGYQGKSCVYCQATASLLSKNLINSKKNKIKELCDYAKSFFNKEQESIEKKWSFLGSPSGNTHADNVSKFVLKKANIKYKSYDYQNNRGSDERQFCWPGVDLPVCSVMRSKYATYKEYHTSG